MLFRIMMFALALSLTTPAQAASFQWMDDQGTLHHLDEYKGKPLLLHLWASWCPPCRSEMPQLTQWLQQHPEVTVLPVSLDNELADAKKFLGDHHFSWPTLLTDSAQAMGMGARGLPSTIVISSEGEVLRGYIGAKDWTDPAFTTPILKTFQTAAQHRP